jgi:acylphosphatase
MRRIRVVISGRVQGVGYRYAMRQAASDAGATGWVRNRRDGTVEAEIQGSDDQLDALLAWAAEGPPMARVDSVSTTAVDPVIERETFEARDTR